MIWRLLGDHGHFLSVAPQGIAALQLEGLEPFVFPVPHDAVRHPLPPLASPTVVGVAVAQEMEYCGNLKMVKALVK